MRKKSLDNDKDRGRKPRIDSDAITSIWDEFDIDRRFNGFRLLSNHGLCEYMDCLHNID